MIDWEEDLDSLKCLLLCMKVDFKIEVSQRPQVAIQEPHQLQKMMSLMELKTNSDKILGREIVQRLKKTKIPKNSRNLFHNHELLIPMLLNLIL